MWSNVGAAAAVAAVAVAGSCEAPVSRCKHAAAVVGGAEGEGVLLLGGRGGRGTTPLTDFWRYDLALGTWRRLGSTGSTPGALQEHSALAHGHRLYVFGGETALSHETPLWVYDMQTEVWRKLSGSPSGRRKGDKGSPASPRPRRGHSAHPLPDCMLLYGGYMDLRGSSSELWAFHYESETWQLVRVCGPAPARHRHAAALHHHRLYVHGGRCDLRACADLHYYDTISHVWNIVRTPAKLSPSARSGHAGLRVGPFFYIYGGEIDGHATNELWRFHFRSETWERMEQSSQWPAPRVDCAVVVVRGTPPGAIKGRRGDKGERGERGERGSMRRTRPDSLLARLGTLGQGSGRGQYLALQADGSAESLVPLPLPKSRSAHAVAPRPIHRSRISVPDFGDIAPALGESQPAGETQLITLDTSSSHCDRGTVPAARPHRPADDEPTSDYCSAERIGFTNPHYLWNADGATLTPDSGAPDLELTPLRAPSTSPRRSPSPHLLVLGGRETHPGRQQAPIAVWLCRLP